MFASLLLARFAGLACWRAIEGGLPVADEGVGENNEAAAELAAQFIGHRVAILDGAIVEPGEVAEVVAAQQQDVVLLGDGGAAAVFAALGGADQHVILVDLWESEFLEIFERGRFLGDGPVG